MMCAAYQGFCAWAWERTQDEMEDSYGLRPELGSPVPPELPAAINQTVLRAYERAPKEHEIADDDDSE